jgi:hypothetical protein
MGDQAALQPPPPCRDYERPMAGERRDTAGTCPPQLELPGRRERAGSAQAGIDKHLAAATAVLESGLRLGRDLATACRNCLGSANPKGGNTKQVLYFPIFYNRVRLVRSVLKELEERGHRIKIIAPGHDPHQGKLKQTLGRRCDRGDTARGGRSDNS